MDPSFMGPEACIIWIANFNGKKPTTKLETKTQVQGLGRNLSKWGPEV